MKYAKRLLRCHHYIKAWLTLLIVKGEVKCLPFYRWSKRCGYFQVESLKAQQVDELSLQRMKQDVCAVACFFPWQNQCLERALAVHRLLSKKRYDHTLYFGLLKNGSGQWLAHAWLRCGSVWVIGYQPENDHTVVGTYAAIFEARE